MSEKIYRVKLNSKGIPNFSTAVEIEDIPIYDNEHNCMMTIFGECSYAETGCGDCAVVEKVRKALPADRPQEWIPCSERLPEKAGHYLCSFKKANRIDSIYVDLAYWTGGRWYGYLANEINAWMPLPAPWKGAENDTN